MGNDNQSKQTTTDAAGAGSDGSTDQGERSPGKESAGKESAGKESAGKESAGKESAGKDRETTRVMGDWFGRHLEPAWFVEPIEVLEDPDEVLVIGRLARPEGAEGDDSLRETAAIAAFRESTREQRMAIAREAEHLFGRQISWGACCGGTRTLFTTLSVPVMTRLRLTERSVLDTLVEAGVARSRSDALAWCVRLVESHESEWLTELREALVGVRRVRAEGPRSL